MVAATKYLALGLLAVVCIAQVTDVLAGQSKFEECRDRLVEIRKNAIRRDECPKKAAKTWLGKCDSVCCEKGSDCLKQWNALVNACDKVGPSTGFDNLVRKRVDGKTIGKCEKA